MTWLVGGVVGLLGLVLVANLLCLRAVSSSDRAAAESPVPVDRDRLRS